MNFNSPIRLGHKGLKWQQADIPDSESQEEAGKGGGRGENRL